VDETRYRPAATVLDRLAGVDFVAVVGPAAVGKTTLIREAAGRELSLHPVLNNTSRLPRPEERDGVDYRFETLTRMRQRVERREYVQVAPNVFGALYATAAEDYATSGVALLAVLAEAVPDFRALPFRRFRVVFVLPPDVATWQNRLAPRGWGRETTTRRMAEAERSLRFAASAADIQFVVNHDLAASIQDFSTLVLDRPWSKRLHHDQLRAKTIVSQLLTGMGSQGDGSGERGDQSIPRLTATDRHH
jgi:guanylate kinase